MAESLRAGETVSEGEAGPRWYACYTRSRHEKRVNALLERRGVESFLPLVPRERMWKDRKKVVDWPMFPSYVFVRSEATGLYDILSLPGISTVVRTNGRPAVIRDAELENIRRLTRGLEAGGVEVTPRPFFAEGEWVEVTEGALAGVRGVVVSERGRRRVLVGLTAIGQGLEVNVDTRLLKAVSAP